MNPRRQLVVIAALLALLVSACGVIGGGEARMLRIDFPSTFNLFEGSAVRVAGVLVGHVQKIDVPEGAGAVHVTVSVKPDVQLPADVRAVIVPQALIGERYIQLDPPYRGSGPTYDLSRTLPVSRASVPDEFDEVIDSLNRFLEALPPEEVSRLVTNLATVLDGNGDELGQTLDNLEVAVDVLRENDDELVRMAGHLADLNETLNTRDEQIGVFIEDFNTVANDLSRERRELEAAIDGLVRVTQELGSLLVEHRGDLEQDLGTLTRLGRTAVRNLDQIDRFFYWSAELYRHAERVIDREHNWLPLVQHFQDLAPLIADRVANRVVGLCLRVGLTDCEALVEELPELMCFDPILPCENAAAPAETVHLADALEQVLDDHPELAERLAEQGLGDTAEVVEEVTEDVTGDAVDVEPDPLGAAGAQP